ncbi:MAG: hypothetical protein ACTTKF_02200 [Bacteroides sp.]
MRPFFLVLLPLFLLCSSCEKEEEKHEWNIRFRFHIGLALPQFSELTVPGGVMTIPDYGLQANGVYVVQQLVPLGTYAAYDVTCPRHLNELTATERTGVVVRCPHCEVEYQLLNAGLSTDGNYQLHPYRTYLNGNVLVVYN